MLRLKGPQGASLGLRPLAVWILHRRVHQDLLEAAQKHVCRKAIEVLEEGKEEGCQGCCRAFINGGGRNPSAAVRIARASSVALARASLAAIVRATAFACASSGTSSGSGSAKHR